MKLLRGLNIRMLFALAAVLFAVFAVLIDSLFTPAHAEATDLPFKVDHEVPKRASYVPPAAELLKKLAPAIVKVTVKKHGVPVAIGSGFFISKNGVLVTSRSVIRPVIADSSLTAEFTLSDKKTLKDFKVVRCELLRESDTCILKLAHEAKTSLSLADEIPEPGSSANAIGHPRGFDAAVTAGSVSEVGAHSEISITAALSAGYAGGPVVNDQGRVLGMLGKVTDEPIDTHRLLPMSAVTRVIDSDEMPVSLADARRLQQDALRGEMRKRASDELDPALGFASRGKNLSGMKGLKEVTMKFDTSILRLWVPDVFDNCAFTQKTRESTMNACYAFGDAAVLSVQRFPSRGYEDLLARNGKRLMEPHLIGAIEGLIRNEEWDLYEPVLTPAQKRSFSSDVSPAQCQVTREVAGAATSGGRAVAGAGGRAVAAAGAGVAAVGGLAFAGTPACRFTVSSDGEPTGHSVNIWLLRDQYLYAIAMWMNDASMAEYFSRAPILAVLTATWEKPLVAPRAAAVVAPKAAPAVAPVAASVAGLSGAAALASKPAPTYQIALPETLSFMGARVERGGAQLDLYGKKLLLDRFEENFLVAVSSQNKTYLPPDFDEVARSAASRVTRAFGTSLQTKTVEIEAMNIAGRPARMLTSFGRDAKGRDVLVLSATLFYDERTFEITEISVTKDTSETFREFKALLAGFKKR